MADSEMTKDCSWTRVIKFCPITVVETSSPITNRKCGTLRIPLPNLLEPQKSSRRPRKAPDSIIHIRLKTWEVPVTSSLVWCRVNPSLKEIIKQLWPIPLNHMKLTRLRNLSIKMTQTATSILRPLIHHRLKRHMRTTSRCQIRGKSSPDR